MAISEDLHLATHEDFLMATDTGPEVPHPVMREQVRTAAQPISARLELVL